MNKVVLIGNLTRDPEAGQTTSNVNWCKFTVAVQRNYKNEKGEYEADFINCVAWRAQADIVSKYFTKGSKIAVVGRIATRNFDGQDGKKVYITEVTVDEVEFVEKKTDKPEKSEPVKKTEIKTGELKCLHCGKLTKDCDCGLPF